MKLSFSTKGWHDSSFDDFCVIAKELKFQGIELHNIHNRLFTEKDGAFHDYAAAATVRKLYELKLSIPCIDSICDCGKTQEKEATVKEIEECINIAKNLKIPAVRVKSKVTDDVDSAISCTEEVLREVLPFAEESGISLLIETSGVFCDTARLRELLNIFACDNVCALWDMYSTYFFGKEDAETTIKNLGAYVRHVHIKDATENDGNIEFCLMGEGSLSIEEMMLALRSVNYDGFVSLEWHPDWCAELDDMEIIFSQFVNFMKQFGDTSKNESAL